MKGRVVLFLLALLGQLVLFILANGERTQSINTAHSYRHIDWGELAYQSAMLWAVFVFLMILILVGDKKESN